MSPVSDADRAYLERAAALGRQGWGRVHPNPLVGCVMVRDGRVLAEAHHRELGGPHAEAAALEAAGGAAPGATAYVSLEPCRHEGRTPACTDALVRAGVRRVVYGAPDPTAEAGGGAEVLRAAGVEVVGPVFDRRRALRENGPFHHTARRPTPWITLKLATSLDGRIAAAPGVRTRLTGPAADREVHRLRAGFDAILVGGGTARADDPLLTVREPVPMRKAPTRVVLDSRARLSPEAALFRDVDTAPLAVFTRDDAPGDAVERLEAAGARVHPVPPAADGTGLDLDVVLTVCRDAGLRSVFCEGGATLAGSLVRSGHVQRLHLFVTPRILGERGVPALRNGPGPARPGSGALSGAPQEPGRGGHGGRRPGPERPEGPWYRTEAPEPFGDDVLLTYDRWETGSPGGGAPETPDGDGS